MLIKLYARGATPHLHIIADVTHIQVDARTTTRAVHEGLLADGNLPGIPTCSFEHLNLDDEPCRAIYCRANDEYQRFLVYNHAYICNDEGRTIEKVGITLDPDLKVASK